MKNIYHYWVTSNNKVNWADQKKIFAVSVVDLENKAYVVYITSICQVLNIYPSWKVEITLLKADEALISVSPKYVDFTDVFFKNLDIELPK